MGKAKEFLRQPVLLEDGDMDMGHPYTMIHTGADVGGGMMMKPMPQAPNAWMPYVHVENVAQSLTRRPSSVPGGHAEDRAAQHGLHGRREGPHRRRHRDLGRRDEVTR